MKVYPWKYEPTPSQMILMIIIIKSASVGFLVEDLEYVPIDDTAALEDVQLQWWIQGTTVIIIITLLRGGWNDEDMSLPVGNGSIILY